MVQIKLSVAFFLAAALAPVIALPLGPKIQVDPGDVEKDHNMMFVNKAHQDVYKLDRSKKNRRFNDRYTTPETPNLLGNFPDSALTVPHEPHTPNSPNTPSVPSPKAPHTPNSPNTAALLGSFPKPPHPERSSTLPTTGK